MRRLLLLLPLLAVALVAACSDSGPSTAPVAIDPQVTAPATGPVTTDAAGVPVYIALGDSLSEGIGASAPASTGFVPLVHGGLPGRYVLQNLGHSGDTSQQLLDHGHLDDAIAEIVADDEDVRLLTLEIGGNDLLRLYSSFVITGVCPDVDTLLTTPACIDALTTALTDFEPNLIATLDAIKAADPSLEVVVLTLYDPFSGRLPVQSAISQVALEGMAGSPFPEGLNTIIRRLAAGRNATLVDLYPLFQGRGNELISIDLIHPNDAGYAVMAEAVIAVISAGASSP